MRREFMSRSHQLDVHDKKAKPKCQAFPKGIILESLLAFVHQSGDRTKRLRDCQHNVKKAKQKRRQEWLLNSQKPTTFFLEMSTTVHNKKTVTRKTL